MNRGKKSKGIALISVLFIAAVVLILASTFIFTVVRERQSTTATRLVSDSLQMADAVSERGRLQVVGLYQDSLLTANNFTEAVALARDGQTSTNLSSAQQDQLNDFVNDATLVEIGDKKGWWRIIDTTPYDTATKKFTGSPLYIEVAATANTANGVQTVVRRINMGQSSIFDLAMLARDTNCLYCHLRVNGDVGSLNKLDPGWGDLNSGTGSKINGNVYALNDVRNYVEGTSPAPSTINGTEVSGRVEIDSQSPKLPRDDDNNIAFPPIKRNVATSAKGTVSGGSIQTSAIGSGTGSLSSAPSLSGGQNNVNAVLIGTEANPILLEGDVYIDGDVVIKGYVKGRGAIYSGRNTYIAGNISYVNPPDDCGGDPDACARTNVRNKKDELRLGSRGSIVMGDYTEKTEVAGVETGKLWEDLTGPNYFRSQFGFWDETTDAKKKCYDKSSGDELNKETDTSTSPATVSYVNVEGKPFAVTDPNLTCVYEKQAYDYSMRPGTTDPSTGNFKSWLSDSEYQAILGKETRKFNTWRYSTADAVSETEIRKQFARYNLDDATVTSLASKTGTFDLKSVTGQTIGKANWDGNFLYVVIDDSYDYATQITKVDAFVYANQRIAGKTFTAPLVVNGGLVAEEIGILAPGMQKFWFMNDPRYSFWDTDDNDCTSEAFIDNFFDDPDATTNAALLQEDSQDCRFTINYDHRLRNGGLGFNLVTADVGRTLSWRISDKKSEHVQ